MFQNLRQNDTIYIIDKSGVPCLKTGLFIDKTAPTTVTPSQTNGLMMNMNLQYEFTIRATVDGQEGKFPNILTTESVHDYGNMIVTSTRESALSEIDKLRMKSQNELDRREMNEQTVDACEEMSRTLNPSYAKEKERDEAINNLSDRLDGIENSMDKILKLLNKK